MTVKELIEKLQESDPKNEVLVALSSWGCDVSIKEVLGHLGQVKIIINLMGSEEDQI